jgi:hypothetical protein
LHICKQQMSEVYKTFPGGLYFVTFTTIGWIDIFIIDQKVDYIHRNPVEAGFVDEPHLWRLSIANENSPIKVLSM